MCMKRINITLPDDVVELILEKPNKSRFIAEAIRDKVEREKKEKLRNQLIEGYKNETDEGRRVNEEWEPGTLESWE
jgi:CopG family transcriptional regulator / antitoxin EndoAI